MEKYQYYNSESYVNEFEKITKVNGEKNPDLPQNEKDESPVGIISGKNEYRFSKYLKLKNDEFKIDVIIEVNKNGRAKMFTENLKYGGRQEIIFDKKKQCYTIKNLDRIRAEWRKNHPKEVIEDDVFKKFIMEA